MSKVTEITLVCAALSPEQIFDKFKNNPTRNLFQSLINQLDVSLLLDMFNYLCKEYAGEDMNEVKGKKYLNRKEILETLFEEITKKCKITLDNATKVSKSKIASKEKEFVSKDKACASKDKESASKDTLSKDKKSASKDKESASEDKASASKDKESASDDKDSVSKVENFVDEIMRAFIRNLFDN